MTSQILTLCRILEGIRAKNVPVTILFVDFTKSFDSIQRGKMEQFPLAYGLLQEIVPAMMILYRNTKVKVRSPDGDTDYFDILEGVLQVCLDYMLRTSIDEIKEKRFRDDKEKKPKVPAQTIAEADYADDIALLADAPAKLETLLHSLETSRYRH